MKILYYNGPFNSVDDADDDIPEEVALRSLFKEPLPLTLFTDSSLWRNGQPLFVPPCAEGGTLWVAPAVRIGCLGKYIDRRWAQRYIDAMGLVVRLRPAGRQPGEPQWAADEAFDSSLCVGEWKELDHHATATPGNEFFAPIYYASAPLSSQFDPTLVRLEGRMTPMIEMETLVAAVSERFTLKSGDVIAAGEIRLGNVADLIDRRVRVMLGGIETLRFKVK